MHLSNCPFSSCLCTATSQTTGIASACRATLRACGTGERGSGKNMSASLNKFESCCFSNDVLKLVKEPHAVFGEPKVAASCTHAHRARKRNHFFSNKEPRVKYHVQVFWTSYCISVSINELPSLSLVCLLSKGHGDYTKELYIWRGDSSPITGLLLSDSKIIPC